MFFCHSNPIYPISLLLLPCDFKLARETPRQRVRERKGEVAIIDVVHLAAVILTGYSSLTTESTSSESFEKTQRGNCSSTVCCFSRRRLPFYTSVSPPEPSPLSTTVLCRSAPKSDL